MLRHFLVVFSLCLCVLCELINKHEGSRCTWNGASGVCVSIYQCESSQFFLKTKKELPAICTFKDKEPIICCTDCALVDDVRKIIFNPKTELLTLTRQKSHDKCVNFIDKLDYDCKINTISNYTRIFNPVSTCYEMGITTEEIQTEEMPAPRESYLALVGYGADIQTASEWVCAGTIISENFILMAANCLMEEDRGPVKYYVAVGIHKRTDPPKMWQKYNVKRIIPHPEFQPPSMYNDIALLETEKTITFSREVLPACLHTHDKIFTKANILVWEEDGRDQGTLIQIPLQQLDEIPCSILFPHDSSQACYGYGYNERPMDSCLSDSGSPLIVPSKRFKCAPSILGVSSFDGICGTAQLITKVTPYIPWIESIVWP